MKYISNTQRAISLLLVAAVLISSCTSTTLIQSTPDGAKVYVDGQPAGTTPLTYSDTKIVGTTTNIKLVKDGYEPLYTAISRNEEVDVGAIIGGIFVWIPFLWVMKYKPVHTYELVREGVAPADTKMTPMKSKADKLRELKQLMDEKLITKEDYEKEKARILQEPDL